MPWVTYDGDGTERVGFVVGDEIHALPAGRRLIDLLGDDGERLARAAEEAQSTPDDVVPLAAATLRSPIAPLTIRDFLCFLGHMRNTFGRVGEVSPVWDSIPAFYFTNPTDVGGPDDDVAVFPGSQAFDFELEVAAVIGMAGANLDPDEAERHIAGYTIYCDWSARDVQQHEMALGLGPAKGKDGLNSLGPWLVTPAELAAHRNGTSYALRMTASINGDRVSEGSLDQMDWSFAEAIAYASRGTRVVPGDVIGSGTVPTGCLVEAMLADPSSFRGFLQPGDRVTLEVERMGRQEHTILPAPPYPLLRTGM